MLNKYKYKLTKAPFPRFELSMAGEENKTVIKNQETQATNVGAQTASLKNNESSVKDDDVAQSLDVGAETMPLKNGEASLKVDNVSAPKKRGRKSKAALKKALEDARNEKDAEKGKGDDVAELKEEIEASSTVTVRKSTRSRKKEKNISVVVDNNESKSKRGRKRKLISSSEEIVAEKDGENGGLIKNTVGLGRKWKIVKKELESGVLGEQDKDSEMPIVENKGYVLRNHRDRKPKYIEQKVSKSKGDKQFIKVT